MGPATPLDRGLGAVLGRLSADRQERRNVFWMTVAYILYGGASAFYGGELWMGFLTKTGFSITQIGVLSSAGTFGGALGLFAFMGLADRIRERIRVYAVCIAISALPPLLTVGIALVPRAGMPLGLMLGLLAALSFLGALNSALWIMLDYPIMVRTISVRIRGRMFAILTTAYGLLAVVLGLLSAKYLRELAFPTGYILFFAIASGLALLRAGAYSRQRELPELAVPGASSSALPFSAIVRVVRLREFQILAGPHVLRGLCAGLAGLAIPMGMRHLALPDGTPGFATAANQAACILGGIALGFIADRWGPGRSTLFGDVLLAIATGTLLLAPNLTAFLALYFLLHFGRNIEDSAVPFGTTIIVPPEHMGAFSAARLMVLQGSSAGGALLFGYLFDHFDPVLLFVIGGLMKLANGVWFWFVFRPGPQRQE
jgi:MFS family permease